MEIARWFSFRGRVVTRNQIRNDDFQYRNLPSEHIRSTLLRLCLEFVLNVRTLGGIQQIALIGSLATEKPKPKDADLLVTIDPGLTLDALARASRRLQGQAHSLNSAADIFLCDPSGYLGRICRYRVCHPRAACLARHCSRRQHLNDDLDIITLNEAAISTPAIVIHPSLRLTGPVPGDVQRVLLEPLQVPRTNDAAEIAAT